jgi:uncharacterized RDD family membrane protein YckC
MSELEPKAKADFNPYQAPTAALVAVPAQDGTGTLASRGSRLSAAFLDGLVPGVIAGVAVGILAATGGLDFGAAEPDFAKLAPVMGLAGLLLLGWIVYTLVLVVKYGQTMGKRWMKIRVERKAGGVAGWARIIFLRGLIVGLLGAIPFVGGFIGLANILMIFREDHRCLHDHIADTVVRNVPQ